MGNNVALGGEKAYKIKLTSENELGQGSYAAVYKIKRRDTKQVFAAKRKKIFKIPYKDMSTLDDMGY
jgi:serine/threonine protein kinase